MPRSILRSITILLGLQLLGEVIARALNLPLPGPVIGMLLLLGILCIRGNVPEDLETSARTLLQNLSLLFVPAGVGAIRFLPALQNEWLPIGASILGSVVLGICATTLAWRILERSSLSKASS